jgi:5-methyltetrahydropteroyltriglutamate--homocysteine methyltransferase
MLTHNLGYPRIGQQRELKWANERYWAGKISAQELAAAGRRLRERHWLLQREAGIDIVPCNDFSFYDHVLDMSCCVGAIPPRYAALSRDPTVSPLDLYFAMARGYQRGEVDLIALEMTKWFDTNYHYLVPEFTARQSFALESRKPVDEFLEAKALGLDAKPVLIGPVSYLLLGKEKEGGFHRVELLDRLLPVYVELLRGLQREGARLVQLDEPFLAMDLEPSVRSAYTRAYERIPGEVSGLDLLVATYFEGLRDNAELALQLPVHALHIDLARAPRQLDEVLNRAPAGLHLSLGVIDGRNVWKNDLEASLALISRAVDRLGAERIMLAPSCSLLHSPCDLDDETDVEALPPEVKRWMAFAKQKLGEVVLLGRLADPASHREHTRGLVENIEDMESRLHSTLIHRPALQRRVSAITADDARRRSTYPVRAAAQRKALQLPLLPTTTIGSFPQTAQVRKLRADLKAGRIAPLEYAERVGSEIGSALRWQEEVGLDVLVHGEFERNDMVQYFGEKLTGVAVSANGWVQSYGSRCVKPPIVYGDVERKAPMTVEWTRYAQSLTRKPVKGMLTGPVTILQWAFVRDDQPRSETALQLALAIRDEAADLERSGTRIIQIDEPAIREGLPLRSADRPAYLEWAIRAFRVASCGVSDATQIHTHMCYSEFNDIIADIADMDADVITIETSRSQMELLEAFSDFSYPNEIGPGEEGRREEGRGKREERGVKGEEWKVKSEE